MNTFQILELLKSSPKTTNVIAHIAGDDLPSPQNINFYGCNTFLIMIGEYKIIAKYLETNKKNITYYNLDVRSKNQALPLLDIKDINARIEPGAIIRTGVTIKDNAIIMMGAVINIGAIINQGTMIDMNAVIGARAIIGKNVHVGAGAVIAGVIEPISSEPVIIEDDVIIGANATILEGVRVKKGAIIGANAVVTKDVEEDAVMIGVPAKKIKSREKINKEKIKIDWDLRK